MKLLKEDMVKDTNIFMSSSDFKNQTIELDKEMLSQHSLIKGSRRTGKSEKVLIPLCLQYPNIKIYIDTNNEAYDLLVSENTLVLDMEKINEDIVEEKTITALVNNQNIYINLDLFNNYKKSEVLLNKIFNIIYNNSENSENKILICIDNIHLLPRINKLTDIMKKNNICIAMTLCYTNQLKNVYHSEEINIIKKLCVMYDVEKQKY